MQDLRVLLVDDDPDCREAFASGLSDHGIAVRTFPDAASLLATRDVTDDADVIVLDWALPDISGMDLLFYLRRYGVTLPVVFLTGYNDVGYESQALTQGAVDFIDKIRGAEIVAARLRLAAAPGPLRRLGNRRHERLVSGKLILRPAINRAYWSGVDVG